MAAWTGWEAQLLSALSYPATAPDVQFLAAWHLLEQSDCRNNPLNTKQFQTGAVNCLPNGVKAYPTRKVGITATYNTLKNGRYPDIIAALKSGDPYTYAQPQKVADQLTTWGTPNFAAEYLLKAGAPAGVPGATVTPGGDVVSLERAWHNLIRTVGTRAPHRATQGLSAIKATRALMKGGGR